MTSTPWLSELSVNVRGWLAQTSNPLPTPTQVSSEAYHYFLLAAVALAALVLLFLGYRVGSWVATGRASRTIAAREQDLFTAQKGFKNLYEQELANLKSQNEQLQLQVQAMNARVEDYRKKAAGFGGLFSTGGKRAEAMYALLLENEALEEALYTQNQKLKQERTDALKEQMRNTGYRRVLMGQLLNDDRIKEVVTEILSNERHLPSPADVTARAPQPQSAAANQGHESHPD